MVGKNDSEMVRRSAEIIPHLYAYYRNNNIRTTYTKEIFEYLGNVMELTDEEKTRLYPHQRTDTHGITYLNVFENDCRSAKNILAEHGLFKRLGNTAEGRGKWELSDLSWKELDERYEQWHTKKRIAAPQWRNHPVSLKQAREEVLKIIEVEKKIKRTTLLEMLIKHFELVEKETDIATFKKDFQDNIILFLRVRGFLKAGSESEIGYIEISENYLKEVSEDV